VLHAKAPNHRPIGAPCGKVLKSSDHSRETVGKAKQAAAREALNQKPRQRKLPEPVLPRSRAEPAAAESQKQLRPDPETCRRRSFEALAHGGQERVPSFVIDPPEQSFALALAGRPKPPPSSASALRGR